MTTKSPSMSLIIQFNITVDRQSVEDVTICITYVPTKKQTADIFTKGLPRSNFNDFIYKLEYDQHL